jgi:Holliday junction DNA helicase RuvA
MAIRAIMRPERATPPAPKRRVSWIPITGTVQIQAICLVFLGKIPDNLNKVSDGSWVTFASGWRGGMLTKVRGVLAMVSDESVTLAVDPFEIEVLISEHTRRTVQSRIGEPIVFHTLFYMEGGAMAGRLVPRLVGFLSPLDREFFDIFCSVDGVGAKKALRAMVRPVRELAAIIQDQDARLLSTFPGIGEATAERIIAKLRRKVGKFALIVAAEEAGGTVGTNGEPARAAPDVIRDTYEALLSVGHSEGQARQAIDRVLASRRKFKSAEEMIEAIYQQSK